MLNFGENNLNIDWGISTNILSFLKSTEGEFVSFEDFYEESFTAWKSSIPHNLEWVTKIVQNCQFNLIAEHRKLFLVLQIFFKSEKQNAKRFISFTFFKDYLA